MEDFIPQDAPIWEQAKSKMYHTPVGSRAYFWEVIHNHKAAAQDMDVITKELALDWLGHPGTYSTLWQRVKWLLQLLPFLLSVP